MTRRLRIVSVCRSLPAPGDPSAGIFVLNRLAALARIADVHIVQPVPWAPIVRPLPDWANGKVRESSGVRIEAVPMLYVPGAMKWLDAYWLARAVGPALRRLHAERPIDLIDAHFGFPDGTGCVAVGAELGVPVFVTVRGNEHEWIKVPRVGERLRHAMQQARGCVAVSHALANLLTDHGVGSDRVRVVHNAIEQGVFNPGDRAAARAEVIGGDTAQGPVIVSVGHLIMRKRHHVMIEAFARVRREFPSARLVIVGARSHDPGYPDELVAQVARLGLGESVRFAGNMPQQQVVQWLRAADLFALVTAREGCCNAVLEALAVGVPVVSTNAGDNAYFLRDDVNGFVVPVDDPAATAVAMSRALRRTDWDRSAISARLMQQVGGWEDVAARVAAFMAERLAGAKA